MRRHADHRYAWLALEVRPRHEDDGSRAERQEQHDAEVEFHSLPSLLSSVHLNEISGAAATLLRAAQDRAC
jgi:hypothetical protein